MLDIKKISEDISKLTILEAAELVKHLEDTLGIKASDLEAKSTSSNTAEVQKKTSFDVLLQAIGTKKIQVIKAVREISELGLKEAKALVDSAPKVIKSSVTEEEANTLKAKLEKLGATIIIK